MPRPRLIAAAFALPLLTAIGIALLLFATRRPPDPEVLLGRKLGILGSDSQVLEVLHDRARVEPQRFSRSIVRLLTSNDVSVREAAASLIASRRLGTLPLDESDLPALLAADESGLAVTRAIARIDTPDATAHVLNRIESEPGWRELKSLLSPHVFSALVERLREPSTVSTRVFDAMCWELRFSPDQDFRIETPLAIAKDTSCTTDSRARAIRLLGFAGERAKSAVPELSAWASGDSPELANAAQTALLRVVDRESAERIMADLQWTLALPGRGDTHGVTSLLADLAELGSRSHEAGALILSLSSDDDWDVRVHATRALGFIGYSDGVPNLIRLLRSDDDWLLAAVAAGSLGRLRAAEGIPELENVAAEHWFPLVRAAARKAVRATRTGEGYPTFPNFRFEFLVWSGRLPDVVPQPVPDDGLDNPPRLQVRTSVGELGRMRLWWYQRRLRTLHYQAGDGEEAFERWDFDLSCGIQLKHGMLLGVDEGEFGHGLYHTTDGRTARSLAAGNIYAIHRMPLGVVVVSGAAMVERGMLYLVADPDAEHPVAKAWRRLPWDLYGVTGHSGLLANGDLSLGGIIVRQDGSLSLVPEVERYWEQMYPD